MDVFRIALIALTMIMEARGQCDLGKAMVADVIMNRGGEDGVEHVVYQPGQFAVWNKDVYGPGHSLRMAVLMCYFVGGFPDDPWCVERSMERYGSRFKVGDAEYWEGVWQLAAAVYHGEWEPPPDLVGKTHFDNPIFWPDGLPSWLQNCVRVGDHVFCE